MKTVTTKRLLASARFLAGDWQGRCAPEEVILEVTTACNLACPMCARTHLKKQRPPASLSMVDFHKLLRRLPTSVQRVAMAGLGEPLLNSNLVEMVERLTAGGFGVVLYTNATLMTAQISRGLVEAGLAGIVIPVDGATAATYEKYRKNGRFDETVANVRGVLAARDQARSALFVEVQMLDLPGTRGQLAAFKSMWAGSGVNALRFKPDHMGVGPDSEARRHEQGVCPMPWRGPATVDVEGNVYPCCVQSPENQLLGNLLEDSLLDIWNGPKARELRRHFVETRRKAPTCHGCSIPLPHQWVSAIGNLVDPFTARKLLARAERFLPYLSGGRKR